MVRRSASRILSSRILLLSIRNQVHVLELLDLGDRYCMRARTLEDRAAHPYVLSHKRKQPVPLTRVRRRTGNWHEQGSVFGEDNQRRSVLFAILGKLQIEFGCVGRVVLHSDIDDL